MRLVIRLVSLLVLLSLVLLFYETNALKVEHIEVPIPGLPPRFEGFRLAHISDLHGRRIKPDGKLVEEIKKAGVDVIAATGDFVDSSTEELDNVLPLMRALSELAPTFAVSGNHDYVNWPEIAEGLRSVGVTVLENSHVVLRRGEDALVIAGVNDPYTRRDRLFLALPEESVGPVILLAHSPTIFERQAEVFVRSGEEELLEKVSLTLTGHTHGGQIKLPFVGAVTTATGRLFPQKHIEGLSFEGSGYLYISRGLGQTRVPFRLFSRPELAIITLTSSDSF